jgi:hypothetical protein
MFKDKAYGYGLNLKLNDKFCGQRKTISFIDTIYWYIYYGCVTWIELIAIIMVMIKVMVWN